MILTVKNFVFGLGNFCRILLRNAQILVVSFPEFRLASYAIFFVVERIEFAVRTSFLGTLSFGAEICVHL